ncbi:MAG: sulfatase-like hydrolase/transferase [Provencibacterium sp.]|jgi:arylsulfatase|nr:sulfatase-like hydrolase/transferase [Provencibacterium sp.]
MNVLWFCTDQQRYDTLGCAGNPFVHTPNLDRLAAMGVRFDRAYSQSPVCAPSRASFLTGRYPTTCSVRQNGQDIDPRERLVPKILSEQGFACGLSGKLHISACGKATGRMSEPRIDDGYDCFQWSHHPGGHGPGNHWPSNAYTLWLDAQKVPYHTESLPDCKWVQTGMPEEFHQTAWCTNCAIDFIESAHKRSAPWMFSINAFDPHHPFDPPAEYLERYLKILDEIPLPNYQPGELENKPEFQKKDHEGAYNTKGNFPFEEMTDRDHRLIRAAYWAMVDLIDRQVGRLLDYLEQSGQMEDTLFIFCSDHGENLGDHGMYLKGPYFYENNVRVPLILAWPGKIEGGRVSRALVELSDLAPTICEAAGLAPEPQMQGKSLWPLLTGRSSLEEHRDSVYSEFYNANINHREPKAYDTMVFDGRYKLVRVHDFTHTLRCLGELYDLEEDPNETFNRYGDPAFAPVKERMLELLCDRMAQTCDPLPLRKASW